MASCLIDLLYQSLLGQKFYQPCYEEHDHDQDYYSPPLYIVDAFFPRLPYARPQCANYAHDQRTQVVKKHPKRDSGFLEQFVHDVFSFPMDLVKTPFYKNGCKIYDRVSIFVRKSKLRGEKCGILGERCGSTT